MAKNKKNTRGVTLIALVISVIVLIILAGITITSLSGDNGILTRAKEAKEKTEQAQKDEERTLSNMENMLGVYKFKNIDTADTNPAEVVPENSIVLEDDANNGIVIKDQNNNEWVWIEVPKTTVFPDLTLDTTTELTEQNYNDIRDKLIEYAKEYRNGSASQIKNNWTDEWYEGCGLSSDEYKELYQKMLKSVYTYGGFWIGRYEAGIEGSIEDISKARKSTSERITIGKSAKAISQKDAIPYNFIYCNEAQELAKEMSPDNNYTSSLMFGIQWDLVCKFLEKKRALATNYLKIDSSSFGNYSNVERIITSENAKQSTNYGNTWNKITEIKPESQVLLTTGASEETNKMNIYDLAGNEWEWTLEHATLNAYYPSTNRGGGYCYGGDQYPITKRGENQTTRSIYDVGFRTTFYD